MKNYTKLKRNYHVTYPITNIINLQMKHPNNFTKFYKANEKLENSGRNEQYL